MMNEKQIYNRMNKCYEELFGDEPTDEWYGDNDPKIWKFYRPRQDITYIMEMNEEEKKIEISIHKRSDGEYEKFSTYVWR